MIARHNPTSNYASQTPPNQSTKPQVLRFPLPRPYYLRARPDAFVAERRPHLPALTPRTQAKVAKHPWQSSSLWHLGICPRDTRQPRPSDSTHKADNEAGRSPFWLLRSETVQSPPCSTRRLMLRAEAPPWHAACTGKEPS